MTDSLSRLVLRAQGRLPVAAPLLPSRFADAAQDAAWGEETGETTTPTATEAPAAAFDAPVVQLDQREATQQTSAAAPRQSPTGTIQTFVETAPPPSPDALPQDVPPVSRQSGPHAVMPPTIMLQPDVAQAAVGVQASVEARRGQADAPRNISRESSPPADRPPPDVARPKVAPPTGRAAEPPLPVSQVPLPALRSAAELTVAPELIAARNIVAPQRTAAPAVRISIGRVEVHAAPTPVQTAAATPPRQAPSRHPTVSLADYLAERGRAR